MEVEVLPHGELAIERVLLGHDPAQLLGKRRMRSYVHAPDECPPRCGHHTGGEHAGCRRLAGAIRTEEAEDLPGHDQQVELVHRRHIHARIYLRQSDGTYDAISPRFPFIYRKLLGQHVHTSPRTPSPLSAGPVSTR